MQKTQFKKIDTNLFLFEDTCNVYILKQDTEAIAIDFGSGKWLKSLSRIGIKNLRYVLLTHAHSDQCYGLSAQSAWPFEVHCSGEDASYFHSDKLQDLWATYQNRGCPPNYAPPRSPLPFAKGDLGDASELRWGSVTVGVVPTPGHTRGALTYVVNWNGKAVAFCGDAAHENGTLHQPYHLEWDHWTGEGALAAWYGLERLGGCKIDVLCPSHGPVVIERANACVTKTQQRVMAFVKSKGSVCARSRDHWLPVDQLENGISRVLPNLYLIGGNTYLLAGRHNQGLVIDPTLPAVSRLKAAMANANVKRVTTAMCTHYHSDHSNGLNWVRDHLGAKVWLHPWVSEPIRDRNALFVPWLPDESIVADRLLPEDGVFYWNRYRFGIRPFPGQTQWHCAFDTHVDDRHVLFSGDNFQPPTRWNGTGGFCAFNGCRFEDGFARSAQAALDLKPDLVCNGHGCIYSFDAGHYRRILKWSAKTEAVVKALCASDAWLNDYDPRVMCWKPFRSEVKAGQHVALGFCVRNYDVNPMQIVVAPVLPENWQTTPGQRRPTVGADDIREVVFDIYVPKKTEPGRYLIAGAVTKNGRLIGENTVALVDVVR